MLPNGMVIKGLKFSLTSDELRTLIQGRADSLGKWLNQPAAAASPKYPWRLSLFQLLMYGAEHLEPDCTYELDRAELQSLFEVFED